MVEIARAFTVTDAPAQLVILDEPTSSLDSVLAGQLLDFVRRFTAEGGSVILISHLLGEVLAHRRPDRGDARRARRRARRRRAPSTAASLVRAMGSVVPRGGGEAAAAGPTRRAAAPVVRARPRGRATAGELVAHAGEIVGLGGLSGHGQTELLVQVFDRADGAEVGGPVALVAGDRQSDGIFPLWSIAENISHRLAAAASSPGRCSTRAASAPSPRTGGSASASARPTSATRSCRCRAATSRRRCSPARSGSDARIIVMDDPMRGVDVGTKQEVYGMIRDEAARGPHLPLVHDRDGRARHCDHVYVFREGAIVADLPRDEMTEEKVIHASFRADA